MGLLIASIVVGLVLVASAGAQSSAGAPGSPAPRPDARADDAALRSITSAGDPPRRGVSLGRLFGGLLLMIVGGAGLLFIEGMADLAGVASH